MVPLSYTLSGNPPLNIKCAITFSQRFIGLLKHDSLEKDQALLIPRCRSIHTMFMSFPIDAIWLDNSGTIIRIDADLQPFRLISGPRAATMVLELAAGQAAVLKWQNGQILPELAV